MAAHEATHQIRQEEIDCIWRKNPILYFLPGLAIGFLVGTFVQPTPQGWFTEIVQSFYAGMWPNFVTICISLIFVQRILDDREKKRRIKDLQEQLVLDASSTSNEIAKNGVHQLRKREWLTGNDGLLKGANLWGANLKEVNLWAANLQGAKLGDAHLEGAMLRDIHLEGADLWRAHLEGTDLRDVHLEGANLWGANLEKADLMFAHLEGADLGYAYLEGADLVGANLGGAKLEGATFDKNTILPDGSQWTPETNMTRFTNPQTFQDKGKV